MKKTFLITFALIGLLTASCTTEETTSPDQAKKSGVIIGEPEATPEQIKQAKSDTEIEVYAQVVTGQTAGMNIRFCKHDPFTNPRGEGYAEITLMDGSVHYAFFTWFQNSLGKTEVGFLYQGTVPSKNSGC